MALQQYLPLAVLKHVSMQMSLTMDFLKVATVLTACGIETSGDEEVQYEGFYQVATVLTACGIETASDAALMVDTGCNSTYRLRY